MCPQQPRQVGGLGLDEATLFSRAQGGCARSLDQLMRQHDGLVQAVVRRQVLGDLPFEEALQAGRIGLWHAILGYDPRYGWHFPPTPGLPLCDTSGGPSKVQLRSRHGAGGWPPQRRNGRPGRSGRGTAVDRALWRLVRGLPARLRYVVVARYGLGLRRRRSSGRSAPRWGSAASAPGDCIRKPWPGCGSRRPHKPCAACCSGIRRRITKWPTPGPTLVAPAGRAPWVLN